ncbi:MAG: putative peptidoglycan lipid flippase, partial [Actinomycetota bacterium]|nr:putative peptidoglycan lipid flippase [Actinomycetota bacterium]
FVEYLATDRREEGWEAANALASVALVGLIALSVLLALIAPLIMRLLTIGVDNPGVRAQEIALGSRFLRLFSPQIALYGAGMVMTGALHAHRRFVLPAVAPIFNNVVVIGVYLTYAAMRGSRPPTLGGITGAEAFVLGAGTTLGVVAMTVALIPQLARLGWRFRWRFTPSHPAVRKGARLGIWALGYAGGYQAGLIVVLMLANRVEGGVAAYQWAYTFFYLPHALFAVPIFNVLFTVMSEHAVRGQGADFLERMREGLGMLAFLLVPIAAVLVAVAHPLARVTLQYGVMTGSGAALVARVVMAFAVGLPAYSAFLVFTRAFYANGDTKTPALINAATMVVASVAGAAFFVVAGDSGDWAVPGLALGHSVAFTIGTLVMARTFGRRSGALGGTKLNASILRTLSGAVAALAVMLVVASLIGGDTRQGALIELVATAGAGVVVYGGVSTWMRSPELRRLIALARSGR